MNGELAVAPDTGVAIADLLLARMALPNSTPKKVQADIAKLIDPGPSLDELDVLRNELAAAGLLAKSKRNAYALTVSGRRHALEFLGVSELPPRTNWTALIAKFMFPLASGLSAAAAARLDNGDKLAAFLLKQKYRLASGSGPTVNRALEAVACKELGFSDQTTLEGVMCAVLNRLLGSDGLSKQSLAKQLPLFETGLTTANADSIRRKIVRDWLAGGSPTTRHILQQHEPFDLTVFAATVQALAARSEPQDRFYDNKVFIAALWRTSQEEPTFPRLSLADFKRRLVEANTHGLLQLTRADLVQAMDPALVAESETTYLTATFHFVLLGEKTP